MDLLGVPLEVSYELWVDEVVHDPVPKWTTPGLVCFFFTLKLTFNYMTLKLEIGCTVNGR